MGADILGGQEPLVVVPAGVWQGSMLEPGVEFALLGATMAPGLDEGPVFPVDQVAGCH